MKPAARVPAADEQRAGETHRYLDGTHEVLDVAAQTLGIEPGALEG